MKLSALGSAFVLSLVAFTAGPAEADSGGKSALSGDLHWTAVSGETGPKTQIIGSSTDVRALYAIRWFEAYDDACKFTVYNRHLNLGSGKAPTADWCNQSRSSRDEKLVVRRGPNEYVTALQVCLTDKKDPSDDKVKGLRVWGRELSAGTLGAANGPDEAKHAHCKRWSRKVSCPSGEIATNIKVYYEANVVGHGAATGIALGCRDVDPK